MIVALSNHLINEEKENTVVFDIYPYINISDAFRFLF